MPPGEDVHNRGANLLIAYPSDNISHPVSTPTDIRLPRRPLILSRRRHSLSSVEISHDQRGVRYPVRVPRPGGGSRH